MNKAKVLDLCKQINGEILKLDPYMADDFFDDYTDCGLITYDFYALEEMGFNGNAIEDYLDREFGIEENVVEIIWLDVSDRNNVKVVDENRLNQILSGLKGDLQD